MAKEIRLRSIGRFFHGRLFSLKTRIRVHRGCYLRLNKVTPHCDDALSVQLDEFSVIHLKAGPLRYRSCASGVIVTSPFLCCAITLRGYRSEVNGGLSSRYFLWQARPTAEDASQNISRDAGENGWHNTLTGKCLHEQIQEARFYRLQRHNLD
jgi:hypothetical protein